jgi:single-strand DNA-binding protein
VIVTGAIAQQRWETDQGEDRSAFAVIAEAVGPDLSYATRPSVRRCRRTGSSAQTGTPNVTEART